MVLRDIQMIELKLGILVALKGCAATCCTCTRPNVTTAGRRSQGFKFPGDEQAGLDCLQALTFNELGAIVLTVAGGWNACNWND